MHVHIVKMLFHFQTQESLRVVKLSSRATVPTRATEGSAGYDLASSEDVVVPKRGRALISTHLSIMMPKNTYGRISSRSGHSLKNGIEIGAGVLDSDFRGHVKVLMYNHSDTDFQVTQGMNIAQLICEVIVTPQVTETSGLPETERGAKGFGSSN